MNVGTQIVRVISAMPGGDAERVLRAIGEGSKGSRVSRSTASWITQGGQSISFIEVKCICANETRIVVLKLGIKEGLFLKDDPDHRWKGTYSLKEIESGVIPVGNLSCCTGNRISSIAQSIVATWVVQGQSFAEKIRQPCKKRNRVRPVKKNKWDRYSFMHYC